MKLLLFFFLVSRAYSQNVMGSFELEDLQGSTSHFNGTVGTTAVALPSVAGNIIAEVLFRCPGQTPQSKQCLISFDGGTTFLTLNSNEFVGWSTKGELRQIHIKGSTSGVEYELVMNREAW